jgi:ATP-dependent helicase/nuclease subunit A
MPEWTASQRQAIRARGDTLVSAAAGAGKTAVLVERVLHLILEERADIDRLLIVTFTNAAAGQMRRRISARLSQALSEGQSNPHLRRQLSLLPAAQISTIHAFCLNLVRRFFHLIGIDPDFRLADESEIEILRRDVAAALLENEYEKADPRFLGLTERIGGSKSDEPLVEHILRLYDFARSQPAPWEWLRTQAGAFTLSPDELADSPWVSFLVHEAARLLAGARELTGQALSFCDADMEGYASSLRADMAEMDRTLGGMGGYEQAREALASLTFTRLGRCGAGADDAAKERVKEWRAQAKKLYAEARESLRVPLDEAHRQHSAMAPYLTYLAELVIAYGEAYSGAKAKRRVADFTDLEHFALVILDHGEAASACREQYDYIFVDEYQDSNLVQETLLQKVSRGGNLFLVGDVKQSIYRFRLADPSLFIRRYDAYETDEGGHRILLNENFRSRSPILDGVNYIFRQIMSRELGEVAYTSDAMLYPGRKEEDAAPPIEVHLIDKGEAESPEEEEIRWMEDAEREAYIAAGRIREWVGTPIRDGDMTRPMQYRDIAILMRTAKGWMDRFAEVLAGQGIPVHADTGAGFFEAVEVRVYIDLLRLIDNSRQDIPLLAAMRSAAGGFTENELSAIRGAVPQGAFHEAVDHYLERGEDGALRDRLTAFTGRLTGWREAERRLPLTRFLWYVLSESGLFDHAGAMPGGPQRQANLRILCERASTLAETGTGRLFGFLRYVDRLTEEGRDIEPARVLGEQENVVRIMSVHKSKGLEFPAVILAGLGKRFNMNEGREEILLHRDMGLGPWYVDPELRYKCQTLARLAVKSRIRVEALAEEMRVLYVAMTRPRERLTMIGTVPSLDKGAARWMRGCGPASLGKGMCLLDWVGAALLHHPDAAVLGAQAAAGAAESSRWDIRLWHLSELAEQVSMETMEQAAPGLVSTGTDGSWESWVTERLSWRYPDLCATRVPSKLSVTEIKRLRTIALTEEAEDRLPVLAGVRSEQTDLTPAERGSIVHYVMRQLDFALCDTSEMIEAQICEMVDRELLRRDEADAVDAAQILDFCRSQLGMRVRGAADCGRELPFLMELPADTAAPAYAGCTEPLLVQGIIDCCFLEGDAWVLLDYKTDSLPDGDISAAADRYRDQIGLYRQALAKLTGKPVKEAYLYFFKAGKAVKMDG